MTGYEMMMIYFMGMITIPMMRTAWKESKKLYDELRGEGGHDE